MAVSLPKVTASLLSAGCCSLAHPSARCLSPSASSHLGRRYPNGREWAPGRPSFCPGEMETAQVSCHSDFPGAYSNRHSMGPF